ncbi:MAG TPA: phosphatase PAP2 family protein [Methanomassiliicoccales archaeon]|jgi:undecaprenyl-diphosphatase
MGMNDEAAPEKNKIFSRRSWIWLGGILAACVVLTLILQLKEITNIDVWLFTEVREQYETALKSFFRVFTDLGALNVWFLAVPLLWAIRRKKEAGAVFIALLMVILIAWGMKYGIDRPRPFEVIQAVDPVYRPTDPSFPSGHAMTVFACALAIGLKWRKALIPLLVLAAAVGYSRVYIGVHYPYDVASGALIGIMIGLFVNSLDLSRIIHWIEVRFSYVRRKIGIARKPD